MNKHQNVLTEKLNGLSLPEINNTVSVPKDASFIKKLIAYSGPGALVAVGYMDPGNWVTSIAGGAQYGYLLLSVILISSLIAMLLQYMAAKLGIVTGMDLAQATRLHTKKKTGDIAEVIGSAVALNLLFGFPLLVGVFITILDVFLLLMLTKLGFRKIEAIVMTLIATIFIIFSYEVFLGQPNVPELFQGFIPRKEVVTDKGALLLALGIVGATVMPHNLYLHSSIVQSRQYNREDHAEIKEAIRFAKWDSNIQLMFAFIVNCLLLTLGATLFFGHGETLTTLGSLYHALADSSIVGVIASPLLSVLFAVALLASGQNSTITGTLSGQIIMEGFIKLQLPTWVRRLITRFLAVIPVVVAILLFGDSEEVVEKLLIYSQVFLSAALPLSIIPLTIFTSQEKLMGEFKNHFLVTIIAWAVTIILTILNIYLIITTFI
jgi:manganese transport protein